MKLKALVLCVAMFGAGCAKRAPAVDISEPRVVLLAAPRDVGDVRAAVIEALKSRGWVAETEREGAIDARLTHKGATVKLSIEYVPERVLLRAVQVDEAGRNLERWLANLESSIRSALEKPIAPATPPPPPTPPPTVAVFEQKVAPERVAGVVQRALSAHNWVLEKELGAGEWIARLNHRKGLVRVKVSADSSQATIAYVESQDLDIDSAGRSADYEKWMRNLVEAMRAASKQG
jgi:hypothetical protein